MGTEWPRMRIIVPAFNCEEFIEDCLESILAQKYEGDVFAIVVDDASTDGTFRKAIDMPGFEGRGIIKRQERGGELASVTSGMDWLRSKWGPLLPDDVILHVCGDDLLPDADVLRDLGRIYMDPEVWMTYGQYEIIPGNVPGHCAPYPGKIVTSNRFREHAWLASHLRSYRYGLWREVPPEQFIDPETGEPWFYATDRAMMFPLMEMARSHIVFIPDTMYLWRQHAGNVPSSVDSGHCARVAAMPRLAALPSAVWRET